MARELLALQGKDYGPLQIELKAIEARLMAWHRANADSRRLAQIRNRADRATTLVMKTPIRARSPRPHFAAWLGLTPKDHSTPVRPGSARSPAQVMRGCAAFWWPERPR